MPIFLNNNHPFFSFSLFTMIFCLPLLAGCGGAGKGQLNAKSTTSAPATSGNARAHFVVQWPQSRAHYKPAVIPAGTNRFVIYVSGANISDTGTVAYVADQPVSGTSTSIDIPVPSGSKRLFAVEARQVAQTKFATPAPVALNDAVLSEGTLLASGNDGTAHDIAPGQSITATVVLSQAGVPGSGTTTVAATINQVLAAYFPTVLALQVIRDQKGNPITNLNAGNFDVAENGTRCVITDVRTVQQASSNLSVALVLDRSGSMAGQKNADLEAAASQFVTLLQPMDLGEVINFSDTVEVTQAFTSDRTLLTQAIQGQFSRFDDSTSLYDGIYQGVGDTAKQSGREAVIALTDGQENTSSHTLNDVLQAAKQNSVPIFTIGLGSDADGVTLGDIAAQTGGIYTFAPASSDLAAIYQGISSQLNGQIQLSFISPDPTKSGTARHVVVNIHYGSLTAQSTYDYTM